MPKLHGFALAQKVRESSWNKLTPIVIVTGRDERDTFVTAGPNLKSARLRSHRIDDSDLATLDAEKVGQAMLSFPKASRFARRRL